MVSAHTHTRSLLLRSRCSSCSHLSLSRNYPSLFYQLDLLVPQTNVSVSVLMIDTVVLCGRSEEQEPPQRPDDPEAAERHWDWIRTRLGQSRSVTWSDDITAPL